MAELRLENLSKSFSGKNAIRAVHKFSLTVQAGECMALLGPSGAGKSTVLRLIGGLETPTEGRIWLNGKAIEDRPAREREVAMAFQSAALLPQLTVMENLCLGPRLRGIKGAERQIDEIAALLGIERLSSRKPETLSGGEQQRVALGRALVARPQVLLLDEPLANLDPLARNELREVIRRVQRELKTTTIYVTHDQIEAAAVADRIALLRDGTLQQVGDARGIYLEPGNLFVAQFFGLDGLNVLRAKIASDLQGPFAEVGNCRFELPKLPALKSGADLAIAFRPTAVELAKNENGCWKITERRDLGWGVVLRLAAGSNEVTAQAKRPEELSVGDVVEIRVEPSRIHLFDLNSGDRLV
jgi:multiple sugar transport system ATP-binding protein